jgi:hypothetical protein
MSSHHSSTSAELLPVTTPSPNSSLATLIDTIPIVSPDERTSMCSGLPFQVRAVELLVTQLPVDSAGVRGR